MAWEILPRIALHHVHLSDRDLSGRKTAEGGSRGTCMGPFGQRRSPTRHRRQRGPRLIDVDGGQHDAGSPEDALQVNGCHLEMGNPSAGMPSTFMVSFKIPRSVVWCMDTGAGRDLLSISMKQFQSYVLKGRVFELLDHYTSSTPHKIYMAEACECLVSLGAEGDKVRSGQL